MIAQILPVAAILASAYLMLVGLGVGVMIIPLRAVAEGWSPVTLAWLGTAYAVAFTAGSVLIPRLVKRAGHIRVFAVIQAMLCASFLLNILFVHPVAWAAFRMLAGVVTAGSYMVMESWINERVSNENRGAVLSAYMVVSMGGVATGQFLAPLGDPAGDTLFIAGALLFTLAVLPIALTSAQSPKPLTETSIDAMGVFRRSPAAAVGSFLAGVIFANWVFFAPVYGKQYGYSTLAISTMLTAAMIGGMVFQFPIGRLSDRIDRRLVMAGAGVFGTLICAAIVVLGGQEPWIVFAATFTLGIVLFPIYSLSVAHANDFAAPEDFVKVSGGLLILYGLGNMAGPQMGGRLMDWMGPDGLFISLGISFLAFGAYALWRTTRRDAVAPKDRDDFRAMPAPNVQSPETYQLDPRSDETPVESHEQGWGAFSS